MGSGLVVLGGALVLLVCASIVWRLLSRTRSLPCPTWLAWMLETGYMEKRGGQATTLDLLDLAPGMRVADLGCGPGRLTFRIADRVGETGEVVALDVQRKMLDRVERRIAEQRVTNVRPLHAGAGEGKLKGGYFDRALLVTVLGEISYRERALREIHEALKPGGILVITEIFPDPHYQRLEKVKTLALRTGFSVGQVKSTLFSYTILLHKH